MWTDFEGENFVSNAVLVMVIKFYLLSFPPLKVDQFFLHVKAGHDSSYSYPIARSCFNFPMESWMLPCTVCETIDVMNSPGPTERMQTILDE